MYNNIIYYVKKKIGNILLRKKKISKIMLAINYCPAIMTSEPLSAGGSPALLHRPLLTPHFVLRSTTLERDSSSETRNREPSGVTSYYATSSVRFHTLDMDQKSLRY